MPTVKEVMQKSIQTSTKSQTAFEASKQMSTKHISCLVIVEKEEPIGIVTRRDILEKIIAEKKDPEKTKISDIMSAPVATIEAKANILYAAAKMNLNGIKQIPVTNSGKIVGIITQTDLVKNINTILGQDLEKIN